MFNFCFERTILFPTEKIEISKRIIMSFHFAHLQALGEEDLWKISDLARRVQLHHLCHRDLVSQ